jgi:hypothetical protein
MVAQAQTIQKRQKKKWALSFSFLSEKNFIVPEKG